MVLFDINLHNEFVLEHGNPVSLFKSYLCSCGQGPPNIDANRARLSCTVCNGTGLLYATPPISLLGLVTGINNRKDLIESGVALLGDCLFGLSPSQENFINDWDMIRFSFEEPWNGQTAIRGEVSGPTPLMTYATTGQQDLLAYNVVRVFRVFRVDPTTNTIIDFHSPGDYSISGRIITWTSTANIATGMLFTVNSTVNFDWIAFASIMQRFDSTQTLGQRVLLRKRHITLPSAQV